MTLMEWKTTYADIIKRYRSLSAKVIFTKIMAASDCGIFVNTLFSLKPYILKGPIM